MKFIFCLARRVETSLTHPLSQIFESYAAPMYSHISVEKFGHSSYTYTMDCQKMMSLGDPLERPR